MWSSAGTQQIQTESKKRRAHLSFLPDKREKLTHSQQLFRFGIARARRSSCLNNLSSSWGNDSRGGKDRKLEPGDFGRSLGSHEIPASKRGNASSPAQERWRTARRASLMVILAYCFPRSRDDSSSGEQDRKLRRTMHPSDQLDRAPGSAKTTANKQGSVSFRAQERWRTSRSASPTVTFGSYSAGSRVEDSGELDRRRWRSAHPSSTSERNLSPPSQVKYFFCLCRSWKKLEDLGNCCCCQAVGEGRSLRRQSKSAEEERHTAQGFD